MRLDTPENKEVLIDPMAIYLGGQCGTEGASTIKSLTYLSVASVATVLSIYSVPKQNTRIIKQNVLMREIRTIYCRYSLAGTHNQHTEFIGIFISLRKERIICLSRLCPGLMFLMSNG